jgi:hypothetical protein
MQVFQIDDVLAEMAVAEHAPPEWPRAPGIIAISATHL